FSTSRTITLGIGGGTFDVSSGNTLTIGSAMSGTGGLAKAGAGALLLNAANTYAGTTTLAAGILRAGIASAIPSSSAVTMGLGSTLDLNSFSQTIGSLGGTGVIT